MNSFDKREIKEYKERIKKLKHRLRKNKLKLLFYKIKKFIQPNWQYNDWTEWSIKTIEYKLKSLKEQWKYKKEVEITLEEDCAKHLEYLKQNKE
jgi:hypothetical protein